jgi:hypothetical protein
MVKVIRVGDDGAEVAAIEVDDFIIEIIYSGIAEMLRDAESAKVTGSVAKDLPREARQRRAKILSRVRA